MKKKKIALLLACCITLVGCGTSKNEESTSVDDKVHTQEQEKPQVEEDNADIEEEKTNIEMKEVRIYTYDSDYNMYYQDIEIEVIDNAIVTALSEMILEEDVVVRSAKVVDGILKVNFNDAINNRTLGSGSEDAMIKCIVNTYGYNLGVEKVELTVGDNNDIVGKSDEITIFDVDTSTAIPVANIDRALFKLYEITDKLEVQKSGGTIEISNSASLEDMLTSLLEKTTFTRDNIKGLALISIVQEGNNKIANIELENYDEQWDQHFQGTAGEASMIDLISETILQRDYPGEWIDGFRLYANGQIFTGPHGTMEGHGTIYR